MSGAPSVTGFGDNGPVSSLPHVYEVDVVWRPEGAATTGYDDYPRDHELLAEDRPVVLGSSIPQFRGDSTKWNPEQLFVASVAQCHMLWYLHLCAEGGIVVVGYRDRPRGSLQINDDGSGEFTGIELRPEVFVRDASMVERAAALHQAAHDKCFISRSIACSVTVNGDAQADRRSYRSQERG